MNPFYKLLLDGADLASLFEVCAQMYQFGGALIEDEYHTALYQIGDLQLMAVSIPLEWNGKRVGAMRVNNMTAVPEIILKALASEIIMRDNNEADIENALLCDVDVQNSGSQQVSEIRSLSDGDYYLYYTDINELDEQFCAELYRKLTSNVPAAVAASAMDYDGIIVIYKLRRTDADALASFLKLHASKYNAPGALSQPFDGRQPRRLLELQKLVMQAGLALYPEQKFFRFEAFASFALFRLLQRSKRLSNYYCEEVLEIIQYDYEYDTALSQSFYVYLFYFGDLKTAAKAMQIHRNTLDYQMKKISQILGKLPNESKRFDIMCTYGMLAMDGGL